ncbi:hypothetical protein SSS_07205 [Sarcoptes scabiei]|uniref:Uncharacterized protein n=1 Tax=Sarcoptes scabiei TaxID=52283 RepID=A0A132A9M2_SARSC|nr:hypothetical protein SSS_07205 [Sarcoptes scabiei]KPM07648.1 hypothetical protein QR98_0061470 [Sarcoptes scabiei]UXI20522.1 actin-like protein 6B [Sarcoptes scabiei]
MATSTLNDTERELVKLIEKAKRMPMEHLEPCKDWTKEEMARVRKAYEKIDQLQNSPKISSKLFNEARDCCDMLHQYLKRLENNMIQTHCKPMNTLTELGVANRATY